MSYRFRDSPPLTAEWRNFRFAKGDGVATVTFTRPEKLNALTFEGYADLRDLLSELPHHQDVRALVIRGEGRGFCGGGDVNEIIGELVRMEPRDLMRFTKMTGDVIRAMRECPIPIVAAVHGIAAGAGAVIALAADFRVVSTSGRFAFLFTRVGLSGGDMGAAYLLPRVVGLGRATELLMLGTTIDAPTADRYGLVSRLVPGRRPRRHRHRPGPHPRRRTHPRPGPDQIPPHPRARHAPRPRHGTRRHDPGPPDDHPRPRRVPHRLHRKTPTPLGGTLTGRTALVTGAGRGIGRAVARRLSAEGFRVALLSRDRSQLADTAAGCAGPTLVVPADVTSGDAVERAFGAVEDVWGPVEVLVAGAGAGHSARVERTSDDDWQRMLDLNLTAVFRCVRRVVPAMRSSGWGRIVVIASTAARVGEPYITAYTASKHGVLGLVRSVAAELAGHGVTANAICPGYVDTPMTDATVAGIVAATGRSEAEARRALERKQAIGRLITPAEVADAVWLCVRDGAVNGQAITVDGGAVR